MSEGPWDRKEDAIVLYHVSRLIPTADLKGKLFQALRPGGPQNYKPRTTQEVEERITDLNERAHPQFFKEGKWYVEPANMLIKNLGIAVPRLATLLGIREIEVESMLKQVNDPNRIFEPPPPPRAKKPRRPPPSSTPQEVPPLRELAARLPGDTQSLVQDPTQQAIASSSKPQRGNDPLAQIQVTSSSDREAAVAIASTTDSLSRTRIDATRAESFVPGESPQTYGSTVYPHSDPSSYPPSYLSRGNLGSRSDRTGATDFAHSEQYGGNVWAEADRRARQSANSGQEYSSLPTSPPIASNPRFQGSNMAPPQQPYQPPPTQRERRPFQSQSGTGEGYGTTSQGSDQYRGYAIGNEGPMYEEPLANTNRTLQEKDAKARGASSRKTKKQSEEEEEKKR